MKITKNQLRRLIREAINEAEFYDETPEGQLVGTEAEDARFRDYAEGEKRAKSAAQSSKLQDAILVIVGDDPGIGGMDIVAAIQDLPIFRGANKHHVFEALDAMLEGEAIYFDEEEDAWVLEQDWELYQAEGGVWSDERDYEAGFMS